MRFWRTYNEQNLKEFSDAEGEMILIKGTPKKVNGDIELTGLKFKIVDAERVKFSLTKEDEQLISSYPVRIEIN
jgi:hypothetical protein